MRRDRGSQRKRVGIDRTAVDQPRLANREGAGLVEDHGVHLGEALERAAILDHDALLEQAPRGNDLHHRNGEAERAGARDDQDRDGDGERPVDVAGCSHPADERRRRSSGGPRERKAGMRGRRCAGTSIVRTSAASII